MSFLPEGQGQGPPPGFDLDKTWQRVHVRNTFIEVDEEPHADLSFSSALDLQGAVPAARTWRRPGHLRCASEPMSFFLSQPPWEPGPWEAGLSHGPFSMPATLPGDSRTERGRPGRNQSQMSQMTIRESLEEYDANPDLRHVPQYIGPKVSKVADQEAQQWCGEPMLVDVRKSSPFRSEDEALASSPEWSGAVPTLALPLRQFRHARQRSRTIQEDAELAQNLDELEADKVHSGQLPWNSLGEHTVNGVNVRVRNTFIEVDEGSDGCTDPSLLSAPTWRPGHLRCASEPIPSWTAPESRMEPRDPRGEAREPVSRFAGFHSRSSSYQDDDGILQSQLTDPDLGPNAHDVFPFVPSEPQDDPRSYNSPAKASCKWHSRGTCKYGDACRFSHTKAVKAASKSKNSTEKPASTQGPLPAGLVPGGTPFPVGAVGEAPKPAGLLPHERPAEPSPVVPRPEPGGRRCRSVSPVSTTAGSSAGDAADKAPGSQRSPQGEKSHQVFWCDARAFKHEFQGFREELENAIGVAAKSHKTAEKCMRLLKKKQRVQAERGRRFQKARPLIFLVSWANAQELVEFLQEAQHMPPLKVVVLCDTNGPRTRATAERWARDMSVVESVAATWPEAVKAVQTLLSSSSALSQQGNA